MILDVNEIQKILPHRYPFLMVDAIVEMERLKRIVGIKNVTINESHFQGHFPGKPIMPGVLIIEAMAQTGGLLLLLEIPDRENKLLVFCGCRWRALPAAGGARRSIESGDESAFLARRFLQAGRPRHGGRAAGRGGHADVQDGGSRSAAAAKAGSNPAK